MDTGERPDVRDAVYPLAGTDPDEGFEDLAPLADRFADARIVALGEATHGTRESQQLRHRVVRFLVRELDVTAIGLETCFTETLPINEYVRSGDGDPAALVDDLHAWPWKTRETLALVEWLRSYNRGRDPDEMVSIHGFDVQRMSCPLEWLADYFERVDPAFARRLGDDVTWPPDPDSSERDRRAAFDELADRVEGRKPEYVAASSREEWGVARRQVRMLEHACEQNAAVSDGDDKRGLNRRDEAMAGTVEWLLDREDADQIALWAHNGHVSANGESTELGRLVTMGSHLRDAFGDAYRPIGFDFGRGSFRAMTTVGGDHELQSHELAEVRDDSLAAAIGEFDAEALYLDVERATGDVSGDWLREERPVRHAGAVFDDGTDGYRARTIADEFDGLAFVEEVTPTRPVNGE